MKFVWVLNDCIREAILVKTFIQRTTELVIGVLIGLSVQGWAKAPVRPTTPLSLTCPTVLPPILRGDQASILPGETVRLTAAECTGTVIWSTGELGASIRVTPHQTTRYTAVCRQSAGCVSCFADAYTVTVSGELTTTAPRLTLQDAPTPICAGQLLTLTAAGCAGQVRWSDGQIGAVRTLTAGLTTRLRAVCQSGQTRSDSSALLILPVVATPPTPVLRSVVRNACPYQTADLTRAIDGQFDPVLTYEFRASADPTAPLIASPGATEAGTYYAFIRNREGCLSKPVAVSANIAPCANAIAPCLSNPPMAAIQMDSLDRQRGVIYLRAQLRGSATNPAWSSSGTGLLTPLPPARLRYVASEADQQAQTVTFTLTTPDPDGGGPCAGARATLTTAISASVSTPDGRDSTQVVVTPGTPEAEGIFIPEGFSPNDDGLNDRFVIRGVTAPATVRLEVFNRWGHRVYAQDNYQNDWDGTANEGIRTGKADAPLPDGTYFYVVRISDGREYVRFMTISR